MEKQNYDLPDPYMELSGPSYPTKPPEDFKKLIGTVRRKSQWEELGFKVKIDPSRWGFVFRKSGMYYKLRLLSNDRLKEIRQSTPEAIIEMDQSERES